jgi:hypothetical protein
LSIDSEENPAMSDDSDIQLVDVFLEGGPLELPAAQRRQRVTTAQVKVKIPYLGGYEHFERSDDSAAIVYRWVTRTRVAE